MDEKRTVLIADDELEVIYPLEKKLIEAGFDICIARDGYAALSKAKVLNPDLILLDVAIQGMNGLEVKNRLNQEESTVNIPVIFMKDKMTSHDKVQGFKLQADDFVTKPFNFPELLARVDLLSSKRKKYEVLFMRDALTGLNNLHIFKKSFASLFNVARRYKRVFSITVIDIDNFKSINDTFGHHIGDLVIRSLADSMKVVFRDTDILIRYGGDEFVVLFPETGEKQALEAVARLKDKVAGVFIPFGAQTKVSYTISAGVASFDDSIKKEDDLFESADKNMYKDKNSKKILKLLPRKHSKKKQTS